MSEETTAPEGEEQTAAATQGESEVQKQAFLERLNKESGKRKEAEKQAAQLAEDLASLKAQMEERESAGLPELERLKKDMERAQKRADEAEAKAAEADARLARTAKERWVTSAATTQNFADPSDASAFVNLDDIEDEKDAERAVKRLAGQKKHLLKPDGPELPGRVLKDGRTETVPQSAAQIMSEEAQMVSDALAQFRKSRQAV